MGEDLVLSDARTDPAWKDGYGAIFGGVQPLSLNLRTFEAMRECLPFLDRAINVLALLAGEIEIADDGDQVDKSAVPILTDFVDSVPLTNYTTGFHSYTYQMLDQALELGFSVGELIPSRTLSGVSGMQVARSTTIEFVEQDGRLQLGQKRAGNTRAVAIEGADLWLDYVALRQHKGHPQGYPLAFAMPQVADLMVRVIQSLKNNWWRFGSPRFHVHHEGAPSGGPGKPSPDTEATLKARCEQFKKDFGRALRAEKAGQVVDLHTYSSGGGKVDIVTMGLVVEALNAAEETWRLCAEQLVAVTGLPPWMLGIHWSTTERLSGRQADMLIANIERLRKLLDPMIRTNLRRVLALNGKPGAGFEYAWPDVNLQDAVEWARVKDLEARADKNQAEAVQVWLDTGLFEDDEAAIREKYEGTKTLAEWLDDHVSKAA